MEKFDLATYKQVLNIKNQAYKNANERKLLEVQAQQLQAAGAGAPQTLSPEQQRYVQQVAAYKSGGPPPTDAQGRMYGNIQDPSKPAGREIGGTIYMQPGYMYNPPPLTDAQLKQLGVIEGQSMRPSWSPGVARSPGHSKGDSIPAGRPQSTSGTGYSGVDKWRAPKREMNVSSAEYAQQKRASRTAWENEQQQRLGELAAQKKYGYDTALSNLGYASEEEDKVQEDIDLTDRQTKALSKAERLSMEAREKSKEAAIRYAQAQEEGQIALAQKYKKDLDKWNKIADQKDNTYRRLQKKWGVERGVSTAPGIESQGGRLLYWDPQQKVFIDTKTKQPVYRKEEGDIIKQSASTKDKGKVNTSLYNLAEKIVTKNLPEGQKTLGGSDIEIIQNVYNALSEGKELTPEMLGYMIEIEKEEPGFLMKFLKGTTDLIVPKPIIEGVKKVASFVYKNTGQKMIDEFNKIYNIQPEAPQTGTQQSQNLIGEKVWVESPDGNERKLLTKEQAAKAVNQGARIVS